MSTYADRVLETSTTTGTGTITLAGAVTGYRTFNVGLGLNILTDYVIEGVDASNIPTGEWETGTGYLSAATTLVRQIPKAGSAATPVSFSAGTKRVFISPNVASAFTRDNSFTLGKQAALLSKQYQG
jgi:hypothetical protein